MKTWMEVQVSWIPFRKGGREKHMPEGTRYCPIIVFPGEERNGSWSAEIFTSSVNDDNKSIIDISYLFPDAPFQLLKPGAEFELYEGQWVYTNSLLF